MDHLVYFTYESMFYIVICRQSTEPKKPTIIVKKPIVIARATGEEPPEAEEPPLSCTMLGRTCTLDLDEPENCHVDLVFLTPDLEQATAVRTDRIAKRIASLRKKKLLVETLEHDEEWQLKTSKFWEWFDVVGLKFVQDSVSAELLSVEAVMGGTGVIKITRNGITGEIRM